MNQSELAQMLSNIVPFPDLESRFFLEAFPNADEAAVQALICRRQSGEPLSKIIGRRGFWKSDFLVNTAVLDPRPDSETIIEAVLKHVRHADGICRRFLDIGTGSGCLLISLLDEYPNAQGVGLDISQEALAVARENAKNRPIMFVQKDLFSSDFSEGLGLFDVIVSNPPYIPTAEIETLDAAVRLYDPIIALDGGADGLSAYRALAEKTAVLLKPDGLICVEIGFGQAPDVTRLFQQNAFVLIDQLRDLGNIDRVLVFKKM